MSLWQCLCLVLFILRGFSSIFFTGEFSMKKYFVRIFALSCEENSHISLLANIMVINLSSFDYKIEPSSNIYVPTYVDLDKICVILCFWFYRIMCSLFSLLFDWLQMDFEWSWCSLNIILIYSLWWCLDLRKTLVCLITWHDQACFVDLNGCLDDLGCMERLFLK